MFYCRTIWKKNLTVCRWAISITTTFLSQLTVAFPLKKADVLLPMRPFPLIAFLLQLFGSEIRRSFKMVFFNFILHYNLFCIFLNCDFLCSKIKGQPVIHPIALLFSSSQQADDLQSLLVELQVKVGATGIVCRCFNLHLSNSFILYLLRSFLGPYSYQVERPSQEQIGLGPSGSIAILEAPCIHLSPTYLIG